MAQHKILTPVIKPMMFVAPRGVAADALAPPPPGVELEALMPSLGGGGGYSYSPRRGADTNLLNDDQRAMAADAARANAYHGIETAARGGSEDVYVGLKRALQRGTLASPGGYTDHQNELEQERYDARYHYEDHGADNYYAEDNGGGAYPGAYDEDPRRMLAFEGGNGGGGGGGGGGYYDDDDDGFDEDAAREAYYQQQLATQETGADGGYNPADYGLAGAASAMENSMVDDHDHHYHHHDDDGHDHHYGGGHDGMQTPPRQQQQQQQHAADPDLECDLCINQDMIEAKAERLRAERAREMELARMIQAKEDADAAVLAQQEQEDRQAARRAAEEQLRDIAARKEAQARQRHAEQLAELAALEHLKDNDADWARRKEADRERWRTDLERQIEMKRQREAQERALELAAGTQGGLDMTGGYDAELAEQNRRAYRQSLLEQIDSARERKAREAMEEVQLDRARQEAVSQQVALSAHDYDDIRAQKRAELEREWANAQRVKAERAAEEAARDFAEANAARAREAAAAEADRRHAEEVRRHRAERARDLQRQIEDKQRRQLAEQAYDKQFSYVPTQTLAQYLIECRRCHRQLPEERFRGSPTKLREYKATHQPTASP